ncbi:hypothetical protein V8G54_022933 [Vigna mungo]|uniref:Uncharacterized protein n=1 Tax=Vigna mungo TaxID=3915 RepID=A0AAQ3N3J2_VIGMU
MKPIKHTEQHPIKLLQSRKIDVQIRARTRRHHLVGSTPRKLLHRWHQLHDGITNTQQPLHFPTPHCLLLQCQRLQPPQFAKHSCCNYHQNTHFRNLECSLLGSIPKILSISTGHFDFI